MSEIEPMSSLDSMNPGYTAEQEPFIVRGHHAFQLWMVYACEADEERIVPSLEGVSRKIEKGSRYYRDAYGDTVETVEQRRKSKSLFLRGFVELEDDAPVRFVDGQPDYLCNSCIVGDHCTKSGWLYRVVDADRRYLHALGRIAEWNGLQDEVTWIDAELPEHEARPTLEMAAGVARRLLSDPQLPAQAAPWIMRSFTQWAANVDLRYNEKSKNQHG